MIGLESQFGSLSLSIEVVSKDLVIELMVLSIKIRVGEYASLHQIICEVWSLLQMKKDVGQRVFKSSSDHDSVLFSEDLVSNTTRRKDRLLSNSSDLSQDLPTFGM